MLDTYNFVCSLKCSWIKTLTLNYKPWMDIFIAMNSSDIVRKILDFGDNFIKKIIKQNNIFLAECFTGMAPNRIYIKKTMLISRNVFPVFLYGITRILFLKLILSS